MKSYFDILTKINECWGTINRIFQREENVLPFLIPGRLIWVKDDYNKVDYGWGIVVNFTKKVINLKQPKRQIDNVENGKPQVIIDVLLYLDKKINSWNQIQPGNPLGRDGILGIVPITLGTVS